MTEMKWLTLGMLFGAAQAQSCGDIRLDYINNNCCGENECSIGIPDCSETTNGKVCFDGTDIVVKGLLDALGFEDNNIVLKKHVIPDSNAAYDLGNAEYKIRHLFLSDN